MLEYLLSERFKYLKILRIFDIIDFDTITIYILHPFILYQMEKLTVRLTDWCLTQQMFIV